ncbi:unnamed protein product [Haemonchus placei]|uniref:Transposase n=1 Tax=Haemonchus placei TaxID=6290 RepID=A0A0N4VV15_HAEPC|nr:unnamed protein product [Haemonchus placei]
MSCFLSMMPYPQSMGFSELRMSNDKLHPVGKNSRQRDRLSPEWSRVVDIDTAISGEALNDNRKGADQVVVDRPREAYLTSMIDGNKRQSSCRWLTCSLFFVIFHGDQSPKDTPWSWILFGIEKDTGVLWYEP